MKKVISLAIGCLLMILFTCPINAGSVANNGLKNLKAGKVINENGISLLFKTISLVSEIKDTPFKATGEEKLLVIDLEVKDVPKDMQVQTLGFQVAAQDKEYIKPGFIMLINLFGKEQTTTGTDGATAYLSAGSKVTLVFVVDKTFNVSKAKISYKNPEK